MEVIIIGGAASAVTALVAYWVHRENAEIKTNRKDPALLKYEQHKQKTKKQKK